MRAATALCADAGAGGLHRLSRHRLALPSAPAGRPRTFRSPASTATASVAAIGPAQRWTWLSDHDDIRSTTDTGHSAISAHPGWSADPGGTAKVKIQWPVT